MFNEIYTQIFEKCKLIKPYERPVLQLWSVLLRNGEKDIVNTFKHNAKTHSTMKEKKNYSSLCRTFVFSSDQSRLACNQIYDHYTFEQLCIKKEFVTINQNARQKRLARLAK